MSFPQHEQTAEHIVATVGVPLAEPLVILHAWRRDDGSVETAVEGVLGLVVHTVDVFHVGWDDPYMPPERQISSEAYLAAGWKFELRETQPELIRYLGVGGGLEMFDATQHPAEASLHEVVVASNQAEGMRELLRRLDDERPPPKA